MGQWVSHCQPRLEKLGFHGKYLRFRRLLYTNREKHSRCVQRFRHYYECHKWQVINWISSLL